MTVDNPIFDQVQIVSLQEHFIWIYGDAEVKVSKSPILPTFFADTSSIKFICNKLKPWVKKSVVLRHNRKFNDMSPMKEPST